MKKNIYIKYFILLVFLNCNSKLPYTPDEILRPPIGLKVFANSGNTFTLYYYVQNKETTFDGYNIYITRESTGGGSNISTSKSLYPVYTANGGYPTIICNKSNFDVNTVKTFVVNNFVQSGGQSSSSPLNLPFEVGKRYFFKMTTHSTLDHESFASNEASAVAIP